LILANYFSIGRLPQQAKDFFNYIRDNSIDLLKSTPGLVGKYTTFNIILTTALKFFINFFLYLVMSHHYGAAGADYRKISSSHFIFDFPLCNHLASPEIRGKIKNKLEDFKKKIILAKKKGNLCINLIF
jgi:hypothetical protein